MEKEGYYVAVWAFVICARKGREPLLPPPPGQLPRIKAADEVRPGLVDVLERLNQVAGELEVMTRRTEALYRHNAAVINDTLGSGG